MFRPSGISVGLAIEVEKENLKLRGGKHVERREVGEVGYHRMDVLRRNRPILFSIDNQVRRCASV